MASKVAGTVKQINGAHLVVEALGSELVVYDKKSDTAHMLDARAAAIWRAAEAGCSVESLLPLVDAPTDEQRDALIQLAVGDLEKAGLLTTDTPLTMPRRSLMKTLGAVAALPLVVSILAPTPAAAASNVAAGTACSFGDTCASGRTCIQSNGSSASSSGEAGLCCVTQATAGNGLSGAACTNDNECCSGLCGNADSSSGGGTNIGTCTGS